MLDLKDSFFSIPLSRLSQPIFTSEWADPELRLSGQLTWTRLPPWFKNSPTIFNEALNQYLNLFYSKYPGVTLIRYVDDYWLLKMRTVWAPPEAVVESLTHVDYKISKNEAQMCSPRVRYLGCELSKGQRLLSQAHIAAILQIPTPTTKRRVKEFLGATRDCHCHLRIPEFAEIAKPCTLLLSEATPLWNGLGNMNRPLRT